MAGNIVIGILRAVLTADTAEFVGGIRQASGNLDKFQKDLGKFGSAMTGIGTAVLPVSAAIVGVGAAAVSAGLDFERSMNAIRGVLQPTATEMDGIREKAIKMGADTAFSATDAANAMLELGKAGFTVQQSMDAVDDVLQLAAASGLSMAEAAELASRTLSAFGLQTADLAHVNDVLAKAVNASTLEIGDLQTAFKYVGPIAQGFGVSIEQASAALAIMRDNGIAAETSGRALREGMSRLANPVKSVQEVMQSLGISTFESGGQLMGLSEIVGLLEGKNLTAAEALKLFGDAAGPGMFALIQKGRPALDGLTESLQKSDGAAKSMADAMMTGLPGALERLRGSVDTALISISKALEPALIRVMDAVASLADFVSNTLVPAFRSLPPFVQTGAIALAAFTAALGPLLIGLGAMATGFKSLIGLFALFGTAQTAATAATAAGATATTAAGVATAGFGVALRATLATLGPYAIAIAGVTAAVTAGYHAYKLYQESKERAAFADKLEAQDKANLARINQTLGTSYTDLNEAVKAAREHAAKLRKAQLGVNDASNQFAGSGLIAATLKAVEAVQRLGGVTKLTAAEKSQLNAQLQQTIEKYKALGQQAPAALVAMEAATRSVSSAVRYQITALEALQAATGTMIDSLLVEIGEIDRASAEAARSAQEASGAMVDALLVEIAELERARIESLASADAAAQQYLAQELEAFRRSKDEETAYRRLQSDIANEIGLAQMEAERKRLEGSKSNWKDALDEIAKSLGVLGQIGGQVMSDLARGVGTVVASINTAEKSWKGFAGGLKEFTSGGGLKQVLGGFASMVGGIGGIVSAASAAISAVKGIWNAISGAFQSEETKHVNRPRDQFFAQYGGLEGLHGQLGPLVGVDETDRLTRQLYDADTVAEFNRAQDAIINVIGGNRFATGTPNLGFMDFGAGTLAMLHGREAVVPEAAAGAFASRFGGDDGIRSEIEGLRSDFAAFQSQMRRREQRMMTEMMNLRLVRVG